MPADMLTQISLAIVAAWVLAFVAKLLRQPLILAYLAAGVLLGTSQGWGWIDFENIRHVSELGLILLLFMIGLEIRLKDLKEAGKTVLVGGVGQAVVGIGLGVLFFQWLGYALGGGRYDALYLSMAVSLSSTIIVVKLLHDKRQLDTTPGRITLGILIVEDIRAILFIALQPNLHNPAFWVVAGALLKTAALVAAAFAMSRYGLPWLFRNVARHPDLMMMANLAWCFLVAAVAGALELSWEMGAFIAGLSIATFPYNHDVIAKITSLRDFFVTLFFVGLGAQIPSPDWKIVGTAVLVSVFLVASRFLSITPFLAWMGAGKRASFLPALNLSQISEFSLVICAIGLSLGHIDAGILSVVVLVLAITSVTSAYSIVHSELVFRWLSGLLGRLGLRDAEEAADDSAGQLHKPIVFLGFAQDASSALYELLRDHPELSEDVAVVDFNPRVKQELDQRHIRCYYGDISHPDVLHHAGIHEARVILSTVPDPFLKATSNARLLKLCRMIAPGAHVIVTAEKFDQAEEFYRQGAAYVYLPRLMGAADLAGIVMAAVRGSVPQLRQAAAAGLASRSEILP